MIRNTMTLDADPELFLEKTMDDIDFIDHSSGILMGYLKENDRLIDRDELLEHFSELEWQFSQVLQEMLNRDGSISGREIPFIREKLTAFRNNSLERRKIIDDMGPAGGTVLSGEPIVSSDELTELLKAL